MKHQAIAGLFFFMCTTSAFAQSFIVDENEATVPSSWPNGSSQTSVAFGGDYKHDNRLHDGSFVEWDLVGRVDSGKCYEVAAIWNANGNGSRATNVLYEIDHDGGTAQSFQNQNVKTNAFNVLTTSGGDNVFQNPTKVRVYTGSLSSEFYVIADAIEVTERTCPGTTPDPQPVNYGPSFGSDMWSALAAENRLYVPHSDDCDTATESFVEIASTGRGFCIEKNERLPAVWEEARDTCASDGKRLPEPGEYKYACSRAASLSLSDMTDDYEWASNTTIPMDAGGGSYQGLGVPFIGNGSCFTAVWGYAARTTPSAVQDSQPFRCVR